MFGIVTLVAGLAVAADTPPRCANWRGWDADRQRDICGPPILPLRPAELAAYQARWRPALLRAARAEYGYGCGRFEIHTWMLAQHRADDGMMRDPRDRRLSPAQREAIIRWRIRVRDREFDRLGRDGRSCRLPSLF